MPQTALTPAADGRPLLDLNGWCEVTGGREGSLDVRHRAPAPNSAPPSRKGTLMSDPTPEPGHDETPEPLSYDLPASMAPKGLLQQMEELLATVSANLAGLGADLRSSAPRTSAPEDGLPESGAHR